MNWVAVGRYIVARTREPSTVHRAMAAVGGLWAALSLSGPEQWVAIVVSASALLGILLPDTESGFGDRESNVHPPQLPPIELVGRPAADPLADQGRAGAGHAGPGADVVQPVDFVRQPVSSQHRAEPDTRPNLGGFGDRD